MCKPAGGAAHQAGLLVLWPVKEAKSPGPPESGLVSGLPCLCKRAGAIQRIWSFSSSLVPKCACMGASANMLLLSASAGGAGASTNGIEIMHGATQTPTCRLT